MLVYSMNQDSAVNLNNVNYIEKEDDKDLDLWPPKDIGFPFHIIFFFNGECLTWKYKNESERNTDFNLIKQKFGERLNEW